MININTSPDKLKKSILQDAMQGKLTEQSSEDGNVVDLLKSIDKEKQRLIKAGKIKKQKKLSPVRDDEKPFSIPDNWQWARLRSICNLINGRAYKQNELFQDETLTPILRVGNLFTNKQWYYSNLQLPENKYIDYGDLIYAWSASFGPRIWYGNKVIFHYHIWKVMMEGMDKSFLYYLLDFITGKVKSSSHGTSIQNITKTKMEKFLVPIPPLSEQKRIVDKLEIILPKVNSFKQSVNSIQTLRNELPSRLRRSFLQSAMQGKLTQQSSKDGDASELLQSIDEEKQRLIKAGKIKKQKKSSPVRDDEIPFRIPDNWKWVRLQSILKFDKSSIRRGPFGSSITKSMFVPKAKNTYKVYEQGNAIHESIEYGDYFITKKKYEELHSFHVKPGDIIISGAGTIGCTYILPNDCPDGVINQALIRIRLNTNVIDKRFFLLLFKAKLGTIQSKAIGSAIKNMASINVLKKQLVWQLPPLAEQKRIVDKLNMMFKYLDNM